MYTIEEFDKQKTQVLKYILYKKRTEQEIRKKFSNIMDENMLEDIMVPDPKAVAGDCVLYT